MKLWALCIFLGMQSLLLAAPTNGQTAPATPPPTTQTTPATPPTMQPSDCSTYTPDEQQFASGLNDQNKAMFCGKFTDVQRAAAMQMTTQPGPTGMMMSPDEAVQKVAAANNLTPATGSKSGGGCPVK